MERSTTKRVVAVMATLALALAACGGDAEDDTVAGDGANTATDANNTDAPDAGGDVTTHNIAWLSDFSGPYADVWPEVQQGHEAVLAWWNDTVGSEMGVRVEGETYDHRYDPSQVASMWPGILSDIDPIAATGVGGPDVAALQERLPDDEVPLFMSTAGYGYAWEPDPWIFNPRATYGHEAAAFLDWFKQDRGLDEVKFGHMTSEASPAYVDIVEGSEKYAEETEGVTYVGAEYADVQPVDLSNQVRRLVGKDVDVIVIQTNTAQAVQTVQALESQGVDDVAVLLSSHNSLTATADAAGGDLCTFNGHYEVFGMAIPAEEEGDAFEFYSMLKDDYGLEAAWTVPTVQGLEQQIYTMRIIEDAIEAVGADELDGVAIREAAINAEIQQEETFSLLSNLTFTSEAPFPVEDLTVNIGTVEDCTYTVAAENVPVPEIPKW